MMAKNELAAAQADVTKLKSQVLAHDSGSATTTLRSLINHSNNARELTSDPLWRAAEVLPAVGQNLVAVRQLAAVTDTVMKDAVVPLMRVEITTLNTSAIKPIKGAIPTEPIVRAVRPVQQANIALTKALTTVSQINTDGTIGQIKAAKAKLQTLLGSVAPLTQTLSTVLPLVAPALGADIPQHYLVMFQNPAEARPLGGTDLSNALITIDHGKVELTRTMPSANFDHYTSPTKLVPIPDGVPGIYADNYGTFIANATIRPDFPSAAQIAQQMWQTQFGGKIDAVISVDPVALSYILRATSPTTLSTGDVLDSSSLVPLLLNTVYQRYWTKNPPKNKILQAIVKDNAAQDAIYAEAVQTTFAKLAGGNVNPQLLLGALEQATSERRLMIWSSDAAEQKTITKYHLDGALPSATAKTDHVGLYVQDSVGSKLDYYLTQQASVSHAVCRPDGRQTYRLSLSLTNGIPANAKTTISPSILGFGYKNLGLAAGEQRMTIYLYAPPGSTIQRSSANGVSVPLKGLHDTIHPVQTMVVDFPPGTTETVSFDVLAEKPGVKKLVADFTPMVNPTTVTTPPLDCATVEK